MQIKGCRSHVGFKTPLWLMAAAVLLASGLVAPMYGAASGCTMSAGPTNMPITVAVGESLSLNFGIKATSDNNADPGDCKYIDLGPGDTILAVFGCGAAFAGAPPNLCSAALADPGVFALPAVGATAVGAGACAGRTFTVTAKDATTGQLTLAVDAIFRMTSIAYGGSSCTFGFASSVLAEPTHDASAASGLQTNSFGFATGTGYQTDGTATPGTGTLISGANGQGSFQQTVGLCQALVDKQVSCDGGTTWFDVNEPESANNDGTHGCIAAAGANIKFQYRIRNADATFAITSCTLTDSNGNVTVPSITGLFPLGTLTTSSFVTTSALACNATNFGGANATNTATLNCTCGGAPATFQTAATVTDIAETGCCGGTLNKQISCDGGTTFFPGTTGQGTPPPACVAAVGVAGQILAKYDFTNTGTITPSCGAIVDTNTALKTDAATECMATRGILEPDTATDSCTCSLTGAADFALTAKSSNNFDCCGVAVDKQVSCDGGVTWNDVGLQTANGDTALGCTAADGATVNFRYFAQNTGSTALSCSFSDNQIGIGGINIFTIPSGISLSVGAAASQLTNSAVTKTCSDTFGSLEPNSGAISCACTDAAGPITNVSAFDEAKVICQPVPVGITKTCADQVNGVNAVTTTVTNPGQLALTNCTVTDTTYQNNPACPPTDTSSPISVTVSPSPFNLASLANQVSTGSVSLTAAACNSASVTCNVGNTTQTVSAGPAYAVCNIPSTGCFTRTPGYWGTHPSVTQTVLGTAGLPVCGITLTNTNAPTTNASAIEDLCGTGGPDFKVNNTSPQELQLIRQCTAAALNLAVSNTANLTCETSFPGITAQFNTCCGGTGSVCDSGKTPAQIDASGCIPFLDAFNNKFDSVNFPVTLTNSPAQPAMCKIANGDGLVNAGRNLGPTKNK